MPGTKNKIVWINVDQDVRSTVESAFAKVKGVAFVAKPDADALEKATAIVADLRHTEQKEAESLLKSHADRLFVVTQFEDIDNINNLLARYPVSHVFGTNGRDLAREITISLRKMISGDIWGLDKYFDNTEHLQTRTVRGAAEINDVIEELLRSIDLSDSFDTATEFLRMTANELTTNAVYNAPVDENNVPKYEQTDRKSKVVLLDNEVVEISFCYDGQYVGISVSDKFGRLNRDKIVRHLVKCVNNIEFIENKKGGAGAGIYLAYYVANQFVINIDEGKRLEAICILEKSKRYKEYRLRITSFNYFKKIGGAA